MNWDSKRVGGLPGLTLLAHGQPGQDHRACLALKALSSLLSPRTESDCGPSGRREGRG